MRFYFESEELVEKELEGREPLEGKTEGERKRVRVIELIEVKEASKSAERVQYFSLHFKRGVVLHQS